MSLIANIYPATMALAGNPIKLSIESSSLAVYTIKADSLEIYTGSGEEKFSVFIQDIIAAAIQPPELYNESLNILLGMFGGSKDIAIHIVNSENEEKDLSLKAFGGGVSKRSLRKLNDENSNIFTSKLLNPGSNFFMTTRTAGNTIYIRETELLPIPFIYPTEGMKIVAAGIATELPGTAGELVALNLYRLRKKLFIEQGTLAAVFEVVCGETKACTIVITPGTVSRERYLLQFLNSFGAYERIEVTGKGKIEHESSGDSSYQVYDEIIDDYAESRERQQGTDTLKVESGYRSSEEIGHLIDMLSSEDVKILGISGRNIRVIPVAENLVAASRAVQPESIQLTLKFADTDLRCTDFVIDDNFGNSRIHTEQFTQEFN